LRKRREYRKFLTRKPKSLPARREREQLFKKGGVKGETRQKKEKGGELGLRQREGGPSSQKRKGCFPPPPPTTPSVEKRDESCGKKKKVSSESKKKNPGRQNLLRSPKEVRAVKGGQKGWRIPIKKRGTHARCLRARGHAQKKHGNALSATGGKEKKGRSVSLEEGGGKGEAR